ncbi:hypothetical protein Tco_0140891 [Tanacetum coccineum]
MADNRTMAQMLQAPIEGYEDAIVVPPINANNFELKQPLINLVQNPKEDPEEDDDEDPEEDPAGGGDDGDDEDESSDDDEDDDVDIEEDEEEEKHPTPVNSTAVALPAVDQAHLPKED